MKDTLDRFQTHALCYTTDATWIAQEMERLELLLPELASMGARDMQRYALAYVERYQHDVLQLEQSWEFLYAALMQAWQRAEYSVVVRLVASLAHPAGRLSNSAVAEHMLYLGIEASRLMQDNRHLAGFLNRLGGLLFAHGKYRQGRRVWYTSLELVRSSGVSQGLWEPLSSFAYIANMLGSYTAAQHFVETSQIDDPDSLAVVIFIRGFYARLTNELVCAHEDLRCCLSLLSLQDADAPPSAYRQLFTMVVQAELARVQGQYTRAQTYTETALALAQLFGDRSTVFDLLFDQVLFTYWQEQFVDTHTTFQRLCDLSRQSADPFFSMRCRLLAQQLAVHLPASSLSQHPTVSTALQEPLSEREREVLTLLAEGYSNREIGVQLVVTAKTVKKHLEHIYNKLDVHSRTAAVARARTLTIIP